MGSPDHRDDTAAKLTDEQSAELASAKERIANLLIVGEQLRTEIKAHRGDAERDLVRVTKQRDAAELALRAAVDLRTELRADLKRAESSARAAWDRHHEKDRAYHVALDERDAALVELGRVTKLRADVETIARNALAAGDQLRREFDAFRAGGAQSEIVQHLRAELDDVTRERNRYRRDFVAMSDRATELAARVTELESEVANTSKEAR